MRSCLFVCWPAVHCDVNLCACFGHLFLVSMRKPCRPGPNPAVAILVRYFFHILQVNPPLVLLTDVRV